MSNSVIRVEGLGKKYVIRHEVKEKYTTLRDAIARSWRSLASPLSQFFDPDRAEATPKAEEFWALKDISFEVEQGDRIGIIGRNGAGKSTLLKILSRITDPTKGKIAIRGRVASLLEVGTGFHPELTGRENIFLNGAILGMSRIEIKQKFDEIVEFAEVEQFLDTPVKRYSSGMYVRLAFAVAAHLEPEILIVDEVLAVGDAKFQRKCIGKMEDVGREGRTVLFVSHNMSAVQQLCTKGLFLDKGQCRQLGDTNTVIESYIFHAAANTQSQDLQHLPRGRGLGKKARICSMRLLNRQDQTAEEFKFAESFAVELECIGLEWVKDAQFVVGIDSIYQNRITTLVSQQKFDIPKHQRIRGRVSIDTLYLSPGTYTLTVGIKAIDQVQSIQHFVVNDVQDLVGLPKFEMTPYGHIQVPFAKWEIFDQVYAGSMEDGKPIFHESV